VRTHFIISNNIIELDRQLYGTNHAIVLSNALGSVVTSNSIISRDGDRTQAAAIILTPSTEKCLVTSNNTNVRWSDITGPVQDSGLNNLVDNNISY